MNIFVLHKNKKINAQYYIDKHVVKMILEYTQLLSSAFYFTNYVPEGIYKLYGKNHPSSKWVRESLDNWLWLKDMTDILIKEYEYRFNKTHKSKSVLKNMPVPDLPKKGLTKFVQVMPEEYMQENVYKAYQTYYLKDKKHLFSWKNRSTPSFASVNKC
jgi:hypothetical protein